MKERVGGSVCPSALGTGLVALDVIVKADEATRPQFHAGGTCGNVLTILSYLGWHSAPISRLARGAATDRVLADLHQWRVSTDYVSVDEGGSTPVIIERISRNARGEARHVFSWRCPGCGNHLPGYRPVLATAAQTLAQKISPCSVFFFDRLSRGALQLARAVRDRAVVVFEPSSVSDPALFREAWSLAHIVKYSHERMSDIAELELGRGRECEVLLEIETLGSSGLRYRGKLPKAPAERWVSVDAFAPEVVRDAAGSGDWCTAGVLDRLARGGLRGLRRASAENLMAALRYGQALAAWNCGFEGPRGGMYEVDKSAFRLQVRRILEGGAPTGLSPKERDGRGQAIECFCPSCNGAEMAAVSRGRKASA